MSSVPVLLPAYMCALNRVLTIEMSEDDDEDIDDARQYNTFFRA